MVRLGPSGSEHTDRRTDPGQRIEPVDELGQDPQGAPWVRVEKLGASRPLEKGLVLGARHPAGEVRRFRADRQAAAPAAIGLVGHDGKDATRRHAREDTMRSRMIAGILLALVGAVWIGQGLGLLRGSSFMVDDIRWALFGAVLLAVGVLLIVDARRRRT